MNTNVLLKGLLLLLVVGLAVVITSWVASEGIVARADPGVGTSTGQWILVTSTIQNGESLLYMFNTEREVLLVYAYYRRAGITNGTNRYKGDLELLAGRNCRWDMRVSQLAPYPYLKGESVPSGLPLPNKMKEIYDKISDSE